MQKTVAPRHYFECTVENIDRAFNHHGVYRLHEAAYMVGVKKSSHLPSVQRDGQYRAIPVPFLVALLVRFQTFPFCPKGSPSVQVNGLDGRIKRTQSLIAQKGSRQFSDCDRARARAIYMYLAWF